MAPVRCPNRFLESVSKKPLSNLRHKPIGLLAIGTTSGFTLLLHNQRLKPDNQCVGRPERRASIVGQGEAGFYRPAMNQSPKLGAVPATSPMSSPNQSSKPGGVGAPQMPLILFRSAGALILLGELISVFPLDCLRYRRGNAGYHRRQGAPCRAPVLIRQDSRNAARSSQTTAARLAWSLIISNQRVQEMIASDAQPV
jgi:hypothetical protein